MMVMCDAAISFEPIQKLVKTVPENEKAGIQLNFHTNVTVCEPVCGAGGTSTAWTPHNA